MEDMLARSALAQAAAIRAGEISSEELVAAQLARIEAVNPALNAVVQLDAAGALEAARRADAALRVGEAAGAFHGVPFTAKDWLETNGLICAAGMAARAAYVPRHDATAVARMRAAGAILLGKTNVQETNEVYGATRNPYGHDRSPGASSSGEASAVAACLSPLGLASDSGGSLRYPAHCCGVATLKPTSGRVPLTGHFPRIGALHDPRTVIGPMSRHVEDLGAALSVIAGPDWRDPSALPVPFDAAPVAVSGMRAGWFVEMDGASPDEATVSAVGETVRALADAGASVTEATPPGLAHSMPITMVYWRRVQSASLNEWAPDRRSTLTADEIERSTFEWDRFRRRLLAFMEGFDVLVCPAAEGPAPAHGSIVAQSYVYTMPFSLVGWPVVTLRAGSAPDGMPIGVQLVAGPWREADALAAAAVVERATGGWKPPTPR